MRDDERDPVPGDSAGEPVVDGPTEATPGADGPLPGDAAAADGPSSEIAPVAPAPASAPTQRRSLGPMLVALGIAVAFAAGVLAGRATSPAPGPIAQASPAASPSDGSAPPASSMPTLPSDGPRLGAATAPVVVDYWADYQCPFCARFADQVIPALRSRIEDGTVLLVHRDYAFLGPESIDAAVAVRCAAREGRYWEMHDAVYAGQVGENQGAFARDRLARIAADVGLDAPAFAACLDEREPLVDVLDDTAAGVRAGISSTPTTEVNGRRFTGVPDLADFLAAVDAAAAGASPVPAPTPQPTQHAWSDTETDGRTAGDPAAPVTVELWMDYQSPDGAVVAQTIGPDLRARIAAGEVRVELHDLALLGDESVTAGALVDCVAAQDGPVWLVHDVLAGAARGAGSGLYVVDNLLRFTAQLGLDVRAIDTCLEDPASAAAVRARTVVGTDAGLTAGPAVVIRRRGDEVARFGAPLDPAAIAAALDEAR